MSYILLVDQAKELPCFDHCEQEVLYTAGTLSKHGNCRVDVFNNNKSIGTYIHGKRKSKEAVIM